MGARGRRRPGRERGCDNPSPQRMLFLYSGINDGSIIGRGGGRVRRGEGGVSGENGVGAIGEGWKTVVEREGVPRGEGRRHEKEGREVLVTQISIEQKP